MYNSVIDSDGYNWLIWPPRGHFLQNLISAIVSLDRNSTIFEDILEIKKPREFNLIICYYEKCIRSDGKSFVKGFQILNFLHFDFFWWTCIRSK